MKSFIENIPLFQDLNEVSIEKIAQICEQVKIPAGETIFQENDPGDSFYVVQTGKVEVLKETGGGATTKLAELGPSSFFGEMALIEGAPRNATIRAVDNSELIQIKKDMFNNLMKSQPSILLKIITAMNKRLREQLEEQQVTTPSADGDSQDEKDAKVISVFSAKGGVGKSLFAVNFAANIAHKTKKKVLVWDLDLEFGIVDFLLNIKSTRTISTLISENDLNLEEIENYLHSHETGMKILPAPSSPEEGEYVNLQHVVQLLRIFKSIFDYIIIDTHSSFHDIVISVLDSSDEIVLLLTKDLPTIKNTKICLDVMKNLKYSEDKISLIINSVSAVAEIPKKTIEQTLGIDVLEEIPNAYEVVTGSINSGKPFVITHPDSEITRVFNKLVTQITGEAIQDVQGKGLFSKLSGFFKK